jgi:hypothetical protein
MKYLVWMILVGFYVCVNHIVNSKLFSIDECQDVRVL